MRPCGVRRASAAKCWRRWHPPCNGRCMRAVSWFGVSCPQACVGKFAVKCSSSGAMQMVRLARWQHRRGSNQALQRHKQAFKSPGRFQTIRSKLSRVQGASTQLEASFQESRALPHYQTTVHVKAHRGTGSHAHMWTWLIFPIYGCHVSRIAVPECAISGQCLHL